jgi:hypothetical protein
MPDVQSACTVCLPIEQLAAAAATRPVQVLTEDPEEANLFMVDHLAYYSSGNVGSPTGHMKFVIE